MSFAELNEPWLGKVPSNWVRSRIRNAATVSPGYSRQAPEAEEICTVVPMEHLSEDGLIDTSIQLPLNEVQAGLTFFEQGDMLFAKITPCMENGKGTFVNKLPTRYGFGSTEFHVLRPRHEVNGKFLYYATFNPVYRAYAAENMTGAAGQKRVSSRFLKDTRLVLPPLLEQERIATYLDASCAAIDVAVAAKRRQMEVLETLLRATLTQILTRGLKKDSVMKPSGELWLGYIPSHWSMKRIKDIAHLQSGDGISAEKISTADQFPVYGGNGLRGYTSSFTHNGYFPLIGRQGALCGNINYARGKFWATEHAVVVTPLRRCDVRWLGELLRIMNLNQYSNAAAQPGLSVDRIKFLRLPVPPVEEQVAIVRHIHEVNEKLTNLNNNLDEQVKTLLAYRKSLIHECVTDQRRVTEADMARVQGGESILPELRQ